MRSLSTATDSVRCETHRVFSRADLVSSLLHEAEIAPRRVQIETGEFQAPVGERPTVNDAGVALGLDDGEGSQTARLVPAQAVSEWYIRGRTGLEELLLQLYFGRLSLAEVESVAAALWSDVDGASVVREVVPGIVERIEGWLNAPTQRSYPYIFLHSVEYRCRRITEAFGMQIAAAVGVNQLGYRETLGIVAVPMASDGLWDSLLATLEARGVGSPRMVVGGTTDAGMRAAVERRWKGCGFLMPLSELERGLLSCVAATDFHWVDQGVSELKVCTSRSEAERVGGRLREKLKKAGYATLSVELGERLNRHLACFEIPVAHLRRLRCANLVRTELIRAREQARLLGPINDEKTMVLLVAATFRGQCRNSWNSKPFLYV